MERIGPLELMPHGHTNHTTRDGSVVTKVYLGPDIARRRTREAAGLRGLAGRIPVPAVLDSNGGSLRMSFTEGVHGQDLISAGQADRVLRACGQMLRRIHTIDPALAHVEDQSCPPAVLVHGDYGPNNVLLDPVAETVVAILDWEWAHVGDPLEDLAWCEWIVRMHHAENVASLGTFFDAYGITPAWSTRQQAMLALCRAHLELAKQWQPGGKNVGRWQRRMAVTYSWPE